MKKNSEISVLVVDDEGALRKSIAMGLELEDFIVHTAESSQEAFQIITEVKIDFVLSDIRMPQEDGVKLLERIRKHSTELPFVLLMTGYSQYTAEEIISKGAMNVINKPFDVDEIALLITETVNNQ